MKSKHTGSLLVLLFIVSSSFVLASSAEVFISTGVEEIIVPVAESSGFGWILPISVVLFILLVAFVTLHLKNKSKKKSKKKAKKSTKKTPQKSSPKKKSSKK